MRPAGRALPLLLDASRAFQDIGACNLSTLDRLASRGQVLTAGAALPSTCIGDDSELITAKLRNTFILAPDASLDDLRRAYNLATGRDASMQVRARGNNTSPLVSHCAPSFCRD